MKARKKTLIDVIQFNTNDDYNKIKERCNNIESAIARKSDDIVELITFKTFSGVQNCYIGDYVNVGDKEPYPIEKEYFENNYEVLEDE